MANSDNPSEILKKAVMNYNMKDAKEAAEKVASDPSADIEYIITDGLVAGIEEVGKLYAQRKVFLPHIINAANVFTTAFDILAPELEKRGGSIDKGLGTVVICAIEGDVHTIGKDIVATMLKVAGFDVINLGRDVPLEQIVEACDETKADIVATSALMTSTMTMQKTLEEMLKLAKLKGKCKTNVGGGPVTQMWADDIGADSYTINADDAVSKFKALMQTV